MNVLDVVQTIFGPLLYIQEFRAEIRVSISGHFIV